MAMKTPFTIAHLSDLHLSPAFYPERSMRFRSILSFCVEREVDHIIITGDITNQAKEEEFRHFREILIEHSLLDSSKVSVITGNHDIFGGPHFAEDVLNFPSLCRSTDYRQKLELFYHYTKETFSTAEFFSTNSLFPYLKVIGGIAVVGLNSVAEWHVLKNPIGSNGRISSGQFDCLRTLLKSRILHKKKILIAIHHHFSISELHSEATSLERVWQAIESTTLKLRKKKRLLRLFSKENVTKVLHGHVHTHGTYTKNGIEFINAGATMIPAKNSPQAFHMITVRDGNIETESVTIPSETKSRRKNIITEGHVHITGFHGILPVYPRRTHSLGRKY
ncbi:MAG: metallophosphoesterase [Bacteroidota bacterium]